MRTNTLRDEINLEGDWRGRLERETSSGLNGSVLVLVLF